MKSITKITIGKVMNEAEVKAQIAEVLTPNQQVHTALKDLDIGQGFSIQTEGDATKTVHSMRVYFAKQTDVKAVIKLTGEQKKNNLVQRTA